MGFASCICPHRNTWKPKGIDSLIDAAHCHADRLRGTPVAQLCGILLYETILYMDVDWPSVKTYSQKKRPKDVHFLMRLQAHSTVHFESLFSQCHVSEPGPRCLDRVSISNAVGEI